MINNLTALNLNGNNNIQDVEDIIMNDEFMKKQFPNLSHLNITENSKKRKNK